MRGRGNGGGGGKRRGSAPVARRQSSSRSNDTGLPKARGAAGGPQRSDTKKPNPLKRFKPSDEARGERRAALIHETIHPPRKSIQPARAEREARDVTGNEKPEAERVATGVQTAVVTPDEAGMRIDRFLKSKFPGLSFAHIQRMVRKGELRVDGKRVEFKGSPGGRAEGAHPAGAPRCADETG